MSIVASGGTIHETQPPYGAISTIVCQRTQVAAMLRVADRSVRRWRAAWRRGGVAALES
ncbi:helix-turn-helix domain-containing protein, partial [Streptomyces sp. NPDC006476]|uniref:helix-turn-helix domain-containing protein n=1 Tax=Streptomyces sp. NPDC006476 TaxID=3157175 RepID=UPI0033A79EDF